MRVSLFRDVMWPDGQGHIMHAAYSQCFCYTLHQGGSELRGRKNELRTNFHKHPLARMTVNPHQS